MAKTAKGQVLKRRTKGGAVWALRFRAYGARRYITLGSKGEGWTRRRAEEELQNILADVRRGIWVPLERSPSQGDDKLGSNPEPTFHRFASDWLAGRRGEVSERSIEYYGWALSHHLLPYFASWRLSEITIETVDAYRRHKVAESARRRAELARGRPKTTRRESPPRPLSATTINKTIDVLQAVLSLAVEYGYIDRNPASGRRRRLKPPARRSIHLDTAEHIQGLLDAASDLDARATSQTSGRRALIATLILAGLRAGEVCALRWRDVDLANGRIHVGRSKTQAGLREITLLPLLRDELAVHKAAAERTGPEDAVFTSASGRARDKDNLRNRVLDPVLRRADELFLESDRQPLPKGVTPHRAARAVQSAVAFS